MVNDNSAPFPQLRSAYLRAIARAWRDPEFQKILVGTNKNPRGALPLLEKDYGFQFPFNMSFNISIATNADGKNMRPVWRPVGTKGWFGFMDEFKLYLPKKPTNPEDEATVLARYCTEFPSLLGAATDGVSQAPPDFAAFGVITSRLVALAWSDPEFHNKLYNQSNSRSDVRDLLDGALDYVVQWNFRLVFEEVPEDSSDSVDYWERFPRSEVTVFLPQQPDPSVEAIALAAYNDTGGQYPFSCA